MSLTLLAVLAGCSSGGTKTKGETFGTPAVSAPSTTIGAGAPRAPGGGGAATSATTPTTRGPDLTLTTFRTPSSNIGCYISADTTRCDIREHTWAAPPKPPSCEFDWGSGIQFSGNDKPTLLCASDTTLDPSSTALDYGQRTRQGSTVCESATAGVTCTNEASGHGFFLSRDTYRIF